MDRLRRFNKKILHHRLTYLLIYVLAWPLLFFFSFLPTAWAIRLGKIAGRVVFYVDARHRRVSLKNLKIAFPHLRASERWNIAIRAFENVGMTFLEFPGLKRQKQENILSRVRYVGWEHYWEATKESKGILLLTLHLGNWELMALSHGFRGSPPLAFVARPLDNPYLENWTAGVRGRSGNRMINKRGALRQVVRYLREGYAVGLLMDQSDTGKTGVFVDLFSHPAGSSVAIAYLAVRSGAPVMPIYIVRDPSDRTYTVYSEPAIPMRVTGKRDADILENTQRCQKVLEAIMRRNPEQYFWMHRRWKGSPTVSY